MTKALLHQNYITKGHQLWYATHHVNIIYPHNKYQKSTSKDKSFISRTQFWKEGRIDRSIIRKYSIYTCIHVKKENILQKTFNYHIYDIYNKTNMVCNLNNGHTIISLIVLCIIAPYARYTPEQQLICP